jgi:hypothetical protein
VSASDAITGRLPWADLDHLVRALIGDTSTRLGAELHGYAHPLDARWMLRALVEVSANATGAEIQWPWLTKPAEVVSDDEMSRAQKIAMAGWG